MPGLSMSLVLALFAASGTSTASVPSNIATSSASSPALDLERTLGPAPLTVTAERLVADAQASTFIAEGDVLLERAGVVLRADRVTFDQGAQLATATGDVVVVDGRTVVFCSAVTMRMPEMLGSLRDAVLYIKSGIPESLRASLSKVELAEHGRNELSVSADALERLGARRFQVSGGEFTACGCAPGESPTWSISATRGKLDLESGAVLWFPVFYAKGVPFFALPAFYLPLGPRRSGLLIPRVTLTSVTGLSLAQPMYIAPFESWDVTLEPGFMFARGPTGLAELRYAPSTTARGEFRIRGLLDRGNPTPEGGWTRAREDALARYAASGAHSSRLFGGALEAEVNLLGDPAFTEFSDRYLSRRAEYAQSRVTFSKTSSVGVRLAVGLGFFEDLRPETFAGLALREVSVLSGALPGPGAIRYRLAELRLDAPLTPVPLTSGAVLGDAELHVDFFTAPRPEVPRFLRADLRPRLLWPIPVAGLLTLEPYAALRLTGWAGRVEPESESASRIAVITGARASTHIYRDFEAFRHSIRPSLEYRLIPFVERRGTRAFDTRDELDRLEPMSQVLARLRTELLAPSGARRLGLDLALGHDFAFRGRAGLGTSELLARADAPLTPAASPVRAGIDGALALDPQDGAVTELIAGVSLGFRTASLALRYGDFASRPPAYALAGPEALVASTADPLAVSRWSPFRGLAVGARAELPLGSGWGRINLASDVTFVFEAAANRPAVAYGPTFLRDTRSTLGWSSSCECFGVGVTVVTDRSRPGFDLAGVLVDLGRLGAVRGP